MSRLGCEAFTDTTTDEALAQLRESLQESFFRRMEGIPPAPGELGSSMPNIIRSVAAIYADPKHPPEGEQSIVSQLPDGIYTRAWIEEEVWIKTSLVTDQVQIQQGEVTPCDNTSVYRVVLYMQGDLEGKLVTQDEAGRFRPVEDDRQAIRLLTAAHETHGLIEEAAQLQIMAQAMGIISLREGAAVFSVQ